MSSSAHASRRQTARQPRRKTQRDTRGVAREAPYDPRILVFACNWCSYAGADTAGVSRRQQTPHFRLLRVMCSGRVHPAFVLRAFARGADGVMVSGCHFGDCHYMFGNYRAADQFVRTHALVELLGLEPERVRLEWVSAAEGARFAELMNEFIAQVRTLGPSPLAPDAVGAAPDSDARGRALLDGLLRGPRLFQCLECGRCTGVCPVARHQAFSPRRLISRALSAGAGALIDEPSLWTCLTCNRCHAVCPTAVDYDRFILSARAAVIAAGGAGAATAIDRQQEALLERETPASQPDEDRLVPCSHGGVFEQISLMMARPALRQKRLGWLTDDLRVRVIPAGHTDKQRLLRRRPARRKQRTDLLYVGCSPYFATYFGGETGEGLTRTMRSAVRLLNRAGITPRLLENERCCGYHLRLSGRVAEAEALEERVIDQLQRSGAHRIITFCPECLIGLRAAAVRRNVPLEILHLSSALWGRRSELASDGTEPAEAQADAPERVTYQDPCRLGRYARIYDPPRDLLTQVAGAELAEMPHHRQHAICCGNTAWLNCNAGTKRLQSARLTEAAHSGGGRLLTACPGCYIHLRCAQEGLEDHPGGRIAIEDLWTYLDRRLSGSAKTEAGDDAPNTEAVGAAGRANPEEGKA
ncbi:MAG: hydrogenase iron-sulfur subunit [Candidatus Eisenbacteria bacterium]|nr:hydrogenase iron-sulfur subunit [Candidatus Eisenbacteria bacterium]